MQVLTDNINIECHEKIKIPTLYFAIFLLCQSSAQRLVSTSTTVQTPARSLGKYCIRVSLLMRLAKMI